MLTVADNTVRSLCFQHLRMCALIAMSILHRLGLFQKFMILGAFGLMMSALPTYLYVSDALGAIAAARHESVGAVPREAHDQPLDGVLTEAGRWPRQC